jgi:hypothetical protein
MVTAERLKQAHRYNRQENHQRQRDDQGKSPGL